MRCLGGNTLSALLAASLLLGCGPDFDPPSELHALRILGVQKDVPYAQPGENVNLQMLWDDASANAVQADGSKRPIEIAWSPPCFDPNGDLYYNCFTQSGVFDDKFTFDDKMSFEMPTDVISRKSTKPVENNAPYGIAYVFFAACAGTLTPITPSADTAFPFGCEDASGTLLGSDDFVAGYTSVYSFKSFSNNNPVIKGFEFNGQPLANDAFCGPVLPDVPAAQQPADCTALAGSSTPADIDCSDPTQAFRCVPTCSDDGKDKCTGYAIRPLVDKTDPANQDQDSVSAQQLGRNVGEQMWIDYYTDGGGFKSAVRLLNDATTGWNDDYGTEFRAPKDAKISRIWTLVHDNRGGVAWAGTTLKTE